MLPEALEFARSLCGMLREAGHTAYFAGGMVRDRLLGRTAGDIDIATSATPADLIALFPHSRKIGAQFGVVLVREGDLEAQIATFRSETVYSDGRRPDAVVFETDPREDVLRRDFTINGLLEDPFTGAILDFVGGRQDLDSRFIRAIGDPARRFAEDHLRMLRAVRFAARLGFDIDPSTMAAIQSSAGRILQISPERVRDELVMILTEGGARRGFELLDTTGLLALVLPEVSAMKGVPQPPEFHPEGDVFTHTLLALAELDRLDAPPPELALAVLLHDCGKPKTISIEDRIRFDGHASAGAILAREILARLRFPSSTIAEVGSLVASHMRFMDVAAMGEAAFKRLLRLPRFDDQLELLRIDTLASHRPLRTYEAVVERRRSMPEEQIRPKPLLTGDHLLGMGYTAGPAMGRILAALEEAQLNNEITTADDARRFVLERFPLS